MSENPGELPPFDVEVLIQETRPTLLVHAAASASAATGAFLLITAFQLWDLVVFRGRFKAIPVAFTIVGIVSLPLAVKIWRQRPWAAVAGLALFGPTALGSSLCLFMSFTGGLISAAAALVPPLAIGAAVTTGLAIGSCRRTAAARRRLATAGLDISV